jgi:hypothetical protein
MAFEGCDGSRIHGSEKRLGHTVRDKREGIGDWARRLSAGGDLPDPEDAISRARSNTEVYPGSLDGLDCRMRFTACAHQNQWPERSNSPIGQGLVGGRLRERNP